MSDEYRELKEMFDSRESADTHASSYAIDPSQDNEMTTAYNSSCVEQEFSL